MPPPIAVRTPEHTPEAEPPAGPAPPQVPEQPEDEEEPPQLGGVPDFIAIRKDKSIDYRAGSHGYGSLWECHAYDPARKETTFLCCKCLLAGLLDDPAKATIIGKDDSLVKVASPFAAPIVGAKLSSSGTRSNPHRAFLSCPFGECDCFRWVSDLTGDAALAIERPLFDGTLCSTRSSQSTLTLVRRCFVHDLDEAEKRLVPSFAYTRTQESLVPELFRIIFGFEITAKKQYSIEAFKDKLAALHSLVYYVSRQYDHLLGDGQDRRERRNRRQDSLSPEARKSREEMLGKGRRLDGQPVDSDDDDEDWEDDGIGEPGTAIDYDKLSRLLYPAKLEADFERIAAPKTIEELDQSNADVKVLFDDMNKLNIPLEVMETPEGVRVAITAYEAGHNPVYFFQPLNWNQVPEHRRNEYWSANPTRPRNKPPPLVIVAWVIFVADHALDEATRRAQEWTLAEYEKQQIYCLKPVRGNLALANEAKRSAAEQLELAQRERFALEREYEERKAEIDGRIARLTEHVADADNARDVERVREKGVDGRALRGADWKIEAAEAGYDVDWASQASSSPIESVAGRMPPPLPPPPGATPQAKPDSPSASFSHLSLDTPPAPPLPLPSAVASRATVSTGTSSSSSALVSLPNPPAPTAVKSFGRSSAVAPSPTTSASGRPTTALPSGAPPSSSPLRRRPGQRRSEEQQAAAAAFLARRTTDLSIESTASPGDVAGSSRAASHTTGSVSSGPGAAAASLVQSHAPLHQQPSPAGTRQAGPSVQERSSVSQQQQQQQQETIVISSSSSSDSEPAVARSVAASAQRSNARRRANSRVDRQASDPDRPRRRS
ncbi:hypothetical protein JCM10908_006017 [Rhodotorula pacifica]|uniref:uncharacterized protein n=1 Tax=Rhodotorula pacifica TaxID=1495444 RepID=UPI0031809C0A